MLAAQIDEFGGPEVLRVREVATPAAGPGEVLVQVEAASVNGHDVITRAGGMKFVSGRKFPIGIGLDFVGTVTAVGASVSAVQAGDRVWGMVHPQQRHQVGSAAQFVAVPEDRVGFAPADLSATDAAALVVAGTTALIALERMQLSAGQRLLVRGAAGGVGSVAVQVARARGADVTAVASGAHAERLHALGARDVLDRKAVDWRKIGPFDAILDTVGSELATVRRRLSRNGRMVTIAISGPALLAIALSSIHGQARIRTFSANPHRAELNELAALAEDGTVIPIVASVSPLSSIADAHRAFGRGGLLGKHVLQIS